MNAAMMMWAVWLVMGMIGPGGPAEPALVRVSAQVEGRGHFSPPSEALSLAAASEDDWSLLDLVEDFSRVTRKNVMISADTRMMLEKKDPRMFLVDKEIPPESVYSFVEAILIENQFVLLDVRGEDPSVLSVRSLETQERNMVKKDCVYVPAERIAGYKNHPALMVTTVFVMPQTDVRTLSNSMRTMLVDANTQQIIPVGSSNCLVLSGTGRQVAQLVEMLTLVRDMDIATAKAKGAQQEKAE